MNLAFSADEEAIREEFRRLLASSHSHDGLAAIQQGVALRDEPLWRRLAETGWLAAAIPEDHGGSDLGAIALCLLAEECGRAATATPFVSSACGFAVGLALSGNTAAQAQWLPSLADGSVTGLVLQAQDWAQAPRIGGTDAQLTVDATTLPVREGATATVALARFEHQGDALVALVPLPAPEHIPAVEQALDPLHPPACFTLRQAPLTIVARGVEAETLWLRLRHRLALYIAFEQLGGAQAALDMARDYSLTRYAFGRAIGSFQALKHSMADMLAALELARANCCYGAAALQADEATLAEAVAVAQISATEAYALCARQNIQIHGGIGVTWESTAHLHYRRAQSLANALGAPSEWKDHLIGLLERRYARAPAAPTGIPA